MYQIYIHYECILICILQFCNFAHPQSLKRLADFIEQVCLYGNKNIANVWINIKLSYSIWSQIFLRAKIKYFKNIQIYIYIYLKGQEHPNPKHVCTQTYTQNNNNQNNKTKKKSSKLITSNHIHLKYRNKNTYNF